MTKGPIIRTILRLALPIMASSFLGTLYNICDMAWVGTLGAKAVAGVGVGGMYIWLSGGFAALPRVGGQVLTAQSIGAGNAGKAAEFCRASIQLILLFGILFGATCLLFTEQLVNFFRLTDEVSVNTAINYIRITCGLIVFSFLNMTLTGLYTADGDSRTPMIANFCGLILNMILDPLLITGIWFFPRLEAIGAAVATVFSQIIVTVILLINMRTKPTATCIFCNQQYIRPCERIAYRQILHIGTPAAIQSMVYCFISMVLTRFVSAFGAEAVAVARVGGQIESVSWNTADGFASALNTFCGQNYGAKQYDRIRKGYLFSLSAALLWGIPVLMCFVFLPEAISSVFFHDSVSFALSCSYLTVIGFCQPFLIVEIATVGALSGLGRTRLCSIVSIILTGLRIPLAYLVRQTSLGINGIWWVMTVTTMIKGILFAVLFLSLKFETSTDISSDNGCV